VRRILPCGGKRVISKRETTTPPLLLVILLLLLMGGAINVAANRRWSAWGQIGGILTNNVRRESIYQ